jgi:hypothetical protein
MAFDESELDEFRTDVVRVRVSRNGQLWRIAIEPIGPGGPFVVDVERNATVDRRGLLCLIAAHVELGLEHGPRRVLRVEFE